jgi:hypothetical protein
MTTTASAADQQQLEELKASSPRAYLDELLKLQIQGRAELARLNESVRGKLCADDEMKHLVGERAAVIAALESIAQELEEVDQVLVARGREVAAAMRFDNAVEEQRAKRAAAIAERNSKVESPSGLTRSEVDASIQQLIDEVRNRGGGELPKNRAMHLLWTGKAGSEGMQDALNAVLRQYRPDNWNEAPPE